MRLYTWPRGIVRRVGEGASATSHTYPVIIAQTLAQHHQITYRNIAVRGAKTSDLLSEQVPKLIAIQPDVITISIGANDTTHLISNSRILANYQSVLRELTNKTKAHIYITNIPNFNGASILPAPFIKMLEWKSSSLNKVLLGLQTDRVTIINIHDFGQEKFPDIAVTYSSDNFHPNGTGYQNWSEAFHYQG